MIKQCALPKILAPFMQISKTYYTIHATSVNTDNIIVLDYVITLK